MERPFDVLLRAAHCIEARSGDVQWLCIALRYYELRYYEKSDRGRDIRIIKQRARVRQNLCRRRIRYAICFFLFYCGRFAVLSPSVRLGAPPSVIPRTNLGPGCRAKVLTNHVALRRGLP